MCTLYSAFGKSLCTQAMVRRFGCQYRSCRWSVLLFHYIQLFNSGWSAIPVKVFNCLIKVYSIWLFQLKNVFSCWIRLSKRQQIHRFSAGALCWNFPETPVPHRNAFRILIQKFRETGSVLEAELSGRPSKLNDKKLMDISTLRWGIHQNRCACSRNRKT
jgi:hypothetical protein